MNLYLETDRLYIRPLMIEDVDFVIELLNSEGWIEFIGDRNVKDIKAANDYIQRILLNNKYFYNVFEIKESNTPIGIVTFLYRENQNYPDIGFAMLPQYEKKGYAFEATKKYLEELQRNQIDKIIAITKPENQNSIKLLKNLGLKFEKTSGENDEKLDIYSIMINNN
jgi:RimJ/RimL family protein N-acetyltransferase